MRQAMDTANRAVVESGMQWAPSVRIQASLAFARVEIAQGDSNTGSRELRGALATAQRDGYLPLAMEAQILMAQTEASKSERQRRIQSLSDDATKHGWKLLAARARRSNQQ